MSLMKASSTATIKKSELVSDFFVVLYRDTADSNGVPSCFSLAGGIPHPLLPQ